MATTPLDTVNASSRGFQRPLRILGIAGSLRRDSYSRAALRAAHELLPKDTQLEFFDLECGLRSKWSTDSTGSGPVILFEVV